MKKTKYHLAVCLLLAAMCVDEYNPFLDPNNAGAVVTGRPFGTDPVVEIFSTDTIAVGVSVPELVTSFRLQTDHNIYWPDTTVLKPTSARYCFAVSFTDTGLQPIRLSSTLSNGVTIQSEDTFRVVSPLHQNDITLAVGDTLRLATRPVKDAFVWYTWEVGPHKKKIRVPEGYLLYPVKGSHTGALWVSAEYRDTVFTSPRTEFAVALKDTTPPGIAFFAENIRGDTILTGDKTYLFNARITDSSGIFSVSMGNTPLKNLFPSQYDTTFRNLDIDTLRLCTLSAIDISGLRRDTTFHVRYVASLGVGQSTRLEILNVRDTLRTNRPSYIITGMVTEKNLPRVNITATVHGNPIDYDTTASLSNFVAGWHFTVGLEEYYNDIVVIARDTVGQLLTSAKLTIFRSLSVKDTDAPFVNVTINGGLAPQHKRYLVPDTSVELCVEANDASGIAEVRVNDSAMTPVEPGFSWRRAVSPISHTESATLIVSVRDNAGNTASQVFPVQKNLTPILRPGYTFPAFLPVGRKLALPLDVIDDDQVTVSLGAAPQGMQVVDQGRYNTWSIVWTPGLADTGMRSVDIMLDDGFEHRELPTWIFKVLGTNSKTVRFQESDIQFPRYAAIGAPVSAILKIIPETGQPPYHFQVWAVDRKRMLLDTTISTAAPCPFSWTPQQADTGGWYLSMTVFDALGSSDTLRGNLFEIMPPNIDPCSLSVIFSVNADTTGGVLDMRYADAPVDVVVIINDSDRPQADHRSVVVDAPGAVWFAEDSTFVYIRIPPGVNQANDTIRVAIEDQEGAHDTVTIPVLFLNWVAPDKLDGLELWLDAGSGISLEQDRRVISWIDSSGNGFTATSNQANRPRLDNAMINSMPAIFFDGLDRRLSGTVPNWFGGPFTLFFVARADTVDPKSRYALFSPSLLHNFGIGIAAGGGQGMFMHQNIDAIDVPNGLGIAQKKWYILTYVSDGLTGTTLNLRAFRSGREGLLPLTITDPSVVNSDNFVLGSTKIDMNDFPWIGYIAEAVMYREALPAQKRVLIENYLSEKYVITLER
jgi:hypothetical protein